MALSIDSRCDGHCKRQMSQLSPEEMRTKVVVDPLKSIWGCIACWPLYDSSNRD